MFRQALLTSAVCALSLAAALPQAAAATSGDGTAMTAGVLQVHLDKFVELRDGSVRAELSFHNPTEATAAFVPPRAISSDAIGGLMDSLAAPRAILANGQGTRYRLTEMSEFGDTQTRPAWISVAAGGTALIGLTFVPDGAARGAQPFALSLPIAESWQADRFAPERTGAFKITFGGLRRAIAEPRRDLVATPPSPAPTPPPLPLVRAEPPAPPAQHAVTAARAEDDLAPLIARLPLARPDAHRYAIAIGVDQYDDAPSVPNADRSAQSMAGLLRKVYGVPDENITLLTGAEATGTRMQGRIASLIQRLTPGDTVFFYYAGHGLAARDGSNVYIVPKDAVPGAYETDALALAALLHRFEASPASRVIAILDTCFSGRVGRDQTLFPGAAPLVPVALPAPLGPGGKTTLFVAAQGNQFANDYPEHAQRLFSYFLMRGLIDGYNDADELEAYVAREVRRVSARRGSEFLQEPQLQGAIHTLPERTNVRPRVSAGLR